MKTNVTMESSDRNLMGVVIRQDTKNEFMCLNDLQDAYDNVRVKKGWTARKYGHILSTNESAERIFYIVKKRGYVGDMDFDDFIKLVEKDGLIKVLKKIGAYKTSGKIHKVMCDPYIWVLVAMEMNPELYAEVVIWLTDKLIVNRIEAGNDYNKLSRVISRFKNPDYSLMAKGLNYIVFGKHQALMRNKGTKEQLKELDMIQNELVWGIDMGFIKSFEQLIEIMRDMYRKKKQNKLQNH